MAHSPIVEWRRLDISGHDVAALLPHPGGWRLSGVAFCSHSGRPCHIEYEIDCDARWATRRCTLRGSVGAAAVRLDVAHASSTGEWIVNERVEPSLAGCDDIDLGFTPATNLLPIRRLELAVGASAVVNAAWVRFPELTTEVLDQVYTRLDEDRYLYESAGGSFRRELVIDSSGFVLDYPGLWRAETAVRTLDSDAALAELRRWAGRHSE